MQPLSRCQLTDAYRVGDSYVTRNTHRQTMNTDQTPDLRSEREFFAWVASLCAAEAIPVGEVVELVPAFDGAAV